MSEQRTNSDAPGQLPLNGFESADSLIASPDDSISGVPDEGQQAEYRRQQEERRQDDERERLRLGLNPDQYKRYYRLVYELQEKNEIEGWKLATGKSEEEYHAQIKETQTSVPTPDVELIDMSPEDKKAFLESVRPSFMQNARIKTDDNHYPPRPQVISNEELLEILKEKASGQADGDKK
jgi:hypothetical protein